MPSPRLQWQQRQDEFFAQWLAHDWPAALATSKESLSFAETNFGPKHPTIVESLLNLARVQHAMASTESAETERAAQTLLAELRTEAVLHPESVATADLLQYEALHLWNLLGNTPEVLDKYQKVISIRERVLGLHHPDTAEAIARLAEIDDLRANFSEAETQYRRAITVFEDAHEHDDPYVGKSFSGLARTLLQLGRADEAWPWFERALSWTEVHPYDKQPLYFLLVGAAECRRALKDSAGAARYDARAVRLLPKANPGAEGFHV